MAKQNVTEEVKALLAVGFTIEYLNERLNVGIDTFDDGAHYEVYGRREEAEVKNFARPYVEIRWTKRNHVWCLGCRYCGQPVDRWGSCYECGSPL